LYRGRDLHEIAARMSYEESVGWLWAETLPGLMSRGALGEARVAAFACMEPRIAGLSAADLSACERQRHLVSFVGEARMSPLLMVAATGTATAIVAALASGRDVVKPDPFLPHASDLLRMATGQAPGASGARALDGYLVTALDHGINSSTLAARLAASTGAGRAASLMAALATLEGPLHGGAPSRVLDMLDAASDAADPVAWIRTELAGKGRGMGFGSRAYKGRDPRADVLRSLLVDLGQTGSCERLSFAEAFERQALDALAERSKGRPLATNLEYYAALLLEALGIRREAFTPFFAAARSAGWAAHYEEQVAERRMLVSMTRYVDPLDAAGMPCNNLSEGEPS
jgi:citrate synthase